MSIDVCILAGGRGSRLDGVWSGPKCLAPVAGRPLLSRLLERIAVLKPRRVALALGYRAEEVLYWLERQPSVFSTRAITEHQALGTAGALRNAVEKQDFLQTPLLVLNGDTLPFYHLSMIVLVAKRLHEEFGTAVTTTKFGGVLAGASVFQRNGISALLKNTDYNLDDFIYSRAAFCYPIHGFLDIGTPLAFRRAQLMKEQDLL